MRPGATTRAAKEHRGAAKEWPVLIVDDEPDVLEVTRLVLKDIRIDGIPLRIQTAPSKAEAVKLLLDSPGPPVAPNHALALIDVVMETDSAGLELCEFLRQNLKNRVTQLYIRTGQAGVAPERAVIDRYDINGYFSKVETMEDKLYSVVKAGVRQHEYLITSLILSRLLTGAIGKSRAGMDELMRNFGDFMRDDNVSVAIVIGGEVLTALGNEAADLEAECRRLDARPGTALSEHGDKMVADGQTVLFKSVASQIGDEAFFIFRGVTHPNPSL